MPEPRWILAPVARKWVLSRNLPRGGKKIMNIRRWGSEIPKPRDQSAPKHWLPVPSLGTGLWWGCDKWKAYCAPQSSHRVPGTGLVLEFHLLFILVWSFGNWRVPGQKTLSRGSHHGCGATAPHILLTHHMFHGQEAHLASMPPDCTAF